MVIDTITQPQWGASPCSASGRSSSLRASSSNKRRSFSGLATCAVWTYRSRIDAEPGLCGRVSGLAARRLARFTRPADARMLFLAAGFGVLLLGSSLRYLALWYLLAAAGEVLISPLGLDLAGSLWFRASISYRHRALSVRHVSWWLASWPTRQPARSAPSCRAVGRSCSCRSPLVSHPGREARYPNRITGVLCPL